MAKTNFTATEKNGYKYHGQATPITKLTSDPQLLLLAYRLAQQGREMDRAHLADRHYPYHPIAIPNKFQCIFC